jgi:hypothetical protein
MLCHHERIHADCIWMGHCWGWQAELTRWCSLPQYVMVLQKWRLVLLVLSVLLLVPVLMLPQLVFLTQCLSFGGC